MAFMKSLLAHITFFVRCNIPERVGVVQARKWQVDIHEMLSHIPFIPSKDVSAYLYSIDFKLSVNENLKDAPMLLNLAVYRNNAILNTNANIDDILNTNIAPCILSYQTDG